MRLVRLVRLGGVWGYGARASDRGMARAGKQNQRSQRYSGREGQNQGFRYLRSHCDQNNHRYQCRSAGSNKGHGGV